MKRLLFFKIQILSFVFVLFGVTIFAQTNPNTTCDNMVGACPDSNFGQNIVSEVGGNDAPSDNDYGCLGSQPNPLWYFIRIQDTGEAIFQLTQYTGENQTGTAIDVDFCVWGPFETEDSCDQLTEDNVIDSSYSSSGVEYIDFFQGTCTSEATQNPQVVNAGEVYIVLITNYSGDPGYINLSPTDQNAATFDCSILGPTYNFCDIGGDGQEEVNLSNYEGEISGGDLDVIVSFHGTSQDAYQSLNPLPTIQTLDVNSLTVYARKDNVVTGEVEVIVITFNLIPVPELQERTLSFCDNDGDGVEIFDLTLADVVVSAEEEVTLSYYTNQDDADAGENAIEDPTYYQAADGTVVYVRADTGDCYVTTTITLSLIDTLELANVSDPKCDNDLDGQETFNLNEYTNDILNGNTGDIRFYENESDAIAGNGNFITNVDNYTTGTITLYAYVAGAGGCNATAELQLTVLDGIELNSAGPYSFCDLGADSVEQIDLTIAEADLLSSATGLTFYYFLNQDDAQNANISEAIQTPTEYALTTETTIYIYVVNTDGCSNIAEVTYVLLQGVEVMNDTLQVCPDTAEGIFNLTTAEVADTFDSIEYYPTLADAQNQQNSIDTPEAYVTVPTTVYALVSIGTCSDIAEITLSFYDDIVLIPVEGYGCDEDLSGTAEFNLNDYVSTILGNSSGDIFFYENQADAEAENGNYIQDISSYETASTVLYVLVGSGSCSEMTTLTLNVFESPELNEVTEPYEFCDDDNNGVEIVDLSSVLSDLGATSPSYTITYHTSQADAQNGDNSIDNPTNYELTSNTNIYVNVSVGNCSSVGMVSFVLHLRPDTSIAESYAICSGYSVNVDAGAGFTSYTWSTGETTQVIEISNLGNYWVDLTFGNGCTFRKEFTVVSGEAPIIANVEAGQNSFTITAEEGTPPYQYSNGGFIYQDSNVISNLNAGTYYLYVRDSEGCVSNVELGVLFEWATLFTPNGDGINDYFVIPNVDVYQGSDIKIYDRGGALVYKGSITTNEVWDGKDMSGNKVPSQDYWYIINLTDGRKFTGHITVKNRTEKGF